MVVVCPHGFPLPATLYGDVLRPPNACHACRSDDSSGTGIRSGVSFYSETNQPFGQESWKSGANISMPDNSNVSNVQGYCELNGFGPPPPDPLQAQARTSLPQTQESRQRPNPPRPSYCNVLFLDGNNGSHVAKRRGPLTEGGRDNIKRLRTKGGACWRCKVLKKQVSLLKSFSFQIVNFASVMGKVRVKNVRRRMQMLGNGTLNANGETSKTISRA